MPTPKSITYPGFNYTAGELSAYTFSIGIFIVSLKDGSLVHFQPGDPAAFEHWLIAHKIRDIRKDNGYSSPV